MAAVAAVFVAVVVVVVVAAAVLAVIVAYCLGNTDVCYSRTCIFESNRRTER